MLRRSSYMSIIFEMLLTRVGKVIKFLRTGKILGSKNHIFDKSDVLLARSWRQQP